MHSLARPNFFLLVEHEFSKVRLEHEKEKQENNDQSSASPMKSRTGSLAQ